MSNTIEATALVAQQPAAITPMALIERAMQNGATIEQLEKLFELKLRVDADNARQAFNAAMSAFKANPPHILKNKRVSFANRGGDNTTYNHATHDHVVDALTPALNAVGLSHRWEMRQDGGVMTVTCILTHVDGHSESATLTAAYDQSGGKNSIQAIVSAKTYLERHTLQAVTGTSTREVDDDGEAAGGPRKGMPEGALTDHIEAIRAAATREDLKLAYLDAVRAARALGDKSAEADFIAEKNKRYAQVQA